MKKQYKPKPIETSHVTLAEEVAALREQLAEHVHDVWAVRRLAEGWKHGAKRDDTAKTHPCLVPYADLPESEKAYDRETAEGTLKVIIALGYRITRD